MSNSSANVRPDPAVPPDAVTPPRSTRWARESERGNMLALRLITWIALHGGRAISRAVLWPVVGYFYVSSPRVRKASRAYLSRVLARPATRLDVLRHLYAFAAVTLDRLYFLNGRLDLFDIDINDEAGQALGTATTGRGMFLMGAHMGSFESVRSLARQQPDLKMVLLMYEENARNIKRLLDAINPAAQQAIISLGQPQAMLQVREQLAQGSLIGILADRSIEATGSQTVDILGGQVALPVGPFRLAAMLKHPVFFMMGAYHGGNRYTINLQPIADFSHVEYAQREQAVAQAVKRYAELIEQHCRATPLNWFNFYDFWPESPP